MNEKATGFKYVGEAFWLDERRCVVANPDQPPFILDFETGEKVDIKPDATASEEECKICLPPSQYS